MHRRLGSATLSQLASTREGNPNFLWEKSHWDNTVVKIIVAELSWWWWKLLPKENQINFVSWLIKIIIVAAPYGHSIQFHSIAVKWRRANAPWSVQKSVDNAFKWLGLQDSSLLTFCTTDRRTRHKSFKTKELVFENASLIFQRVLFSVDWMVWRTWSVVTLLKAEHQT